MQQPEYWRIVAKVCDFAFQPIVDIGTGRIFGVEALLRGQETAGYASIKELFEAAFQAGMLNPFELYLREKVMHRFRALGSLGRLQLFINIDNRVMAMPDYDPAATGELMLRFGLDPAQVCFELSEQHAFKCFDRTREILSAYRAMGSQIAVDDYGTGFAGLELLYHSEPDFIKLDRFFVSGLDADPKKRLFVGGIVQLAHSLGITVIAEGVETAAELLTCRELGCDLVQGWAIQKPTLDPGELKESYPVGSRQLQLAIA
jgi:EAL domain-containing protein (putative c-di-GMP-specific phosphodiesterase class I)